MNSIKKNDKVTIKIPRPLYNHFKLIKENLGFNSVTDFVVYVLRNIASSSKPKDTQNRD